MEKTYSYISKSLWVRQRQRQRGNVERAISLPEVPSSRNQRLTWSMFDRIGGIHIQGKREGEEREGEEREEREREEENENDEKDGQIPSRRNHWKTPTHTEHGVAAHGKRVVVCDSRWTSKGGSGDEEAEKDTDLRDWNLFLFVSSRFMSSSKYREWDVDGRLLVCMMRTGEEREEWHPIRDERTWENGRVEGKESRIADPQIKARKRNAERRSLIWEFIRFKSRAEDNQRSSDSGFDCDEPFERPRTCCVIPTVAATLWRMIEHTCSMNV